MVIHTASVAGFSQGFGRSAGFGQGTPRSFFAAQCVGGGKGVGNFAKAVWMVPS